MENRFDEMTKLLAEGMPRRAALWRLGGLFGGAILAALGWGTKTRADSTASECAHFCNEHFPGGKDREACKRNCRLCGGPSRLCFGPPGTVPACCRPPLKCCCGICTAVSGFCCGRNCCPDDDLCCPTAFDGPICVPNDANNCGACGNKCVTAAGVVGNCCNKKCCFPPDTCCVSTVPGAVPVCTDLSSDPTNCGACGNICPPGPAGPVDCCGTKCCSPVTPTCCRIPGVAPYCANLLTDVNNCGRCGNVCPPSPTHVVTCVAGVCV